MISLKQTKWLLFTVVLTLVACEDASIYDKSRSVDNNTWHSDDIKEFSFEVEDTLSPMNLYINLRTTTDYPYENIYMFLYTKFPHQEEKKDTLQFILAQPDGKWNGDKTGTVVEFQSLISTRGTFVHSGTYSFKLQHAMREANLNEIIDVGLRVEKHTD